MKPMQILITMDVEVPRQEAGASGPPDWETSQRYIRAYADLAYEAGFPVSFFIHPEAALRHRDLFEELRVTRQACIEGLHLHPWKFTDRHYQYHLGGMTADEQRQIISEAIALWQQAFGRRPIYFRPGTFSANDATFGVLVELGFQGGSVSAPGRVMPDLNAVWVGAPRDPHRPHHAMRLLQGSLPFANLPLSHDYARRVEQGCRSFHPDLRPCRDDGDMGLLVRQVMRQTIERDAPVQIMHMDTHNDHDYTDPSDAVRQRYCALLAELHAAGRELGVDVRGATIEGITREVLALPVEDRPFVFA
jgi:hypothetical protein